jgi:hypothetical protein
MDQEMVSGYNRRHVVEDFEVVYEVESKASKFQRFKTKPSKTISVS